MKTTSIQLEKLYDLPCHVYWKDQKGVYLGSNDYHGLTGGTKGSDFITLSDFDIHATECASLFQTDDRFVIEKNTSLSKLESINFNEKFNDGKKFEAFTFKQPLYNRRNKIIGVMGLSFILGENNTFPDFFHHLQLPNQHRIIEQASRLKNISNEFDLLTPRQADCLYYVVQGKTAKQIAALLHLSHRTVEHHLNAIKDKYHCDSRSELISLGLKMDFIRQRIAKAV